MLYYAHEPVSPNTTPLSPIARERRFRVSAQAGAAHHDTICIFGRIGRNARTPPRYGKIGNPRAENRKIGRNGKSAPSTANCENRQDRQFPAPKDENAAEMAIEVNVHNRKMRQDRQVRPVQNRTAGRHADRPTTAPPRLGPLAKPTFPSRREGGVPFWGLGRGLGAQSRQKRRHPLPARLSHPLCPLWLSPPTAPAY